MAEIIPFFAVPFAFARHPDPAPLNARLRELFIARAAEGAAYANPRPITQRNAPVFESRFDLFRWEDAAVRELKEFSATFPVILVDELVVRRNLPSVTAALLERMG